MQYVDVPTVSCRLVVIDPSCCLSVVMCAVRFVFREAILCIAFHGLVTEVILQNSFQDFLSSHLMAAAYSALDARYCTFLRSRRSGLSFVRWYLRLFAFTSFLCNVISSPVMLSVPAALFVFSLLIIVQISLYVGGAISS